MSGPRVGIPLRSEISSHSHCSCFIIYKHQLYQNREICPFSTDMNSFDALAEVYLWRQHVEKSLQASFGMRIYPLNLVVSHNALFLVVRMQALSDTTRFRRQEPRNRGLNK